MRWFAVFTMVCTVVSLLLASMMVLWRWWSGTSWRGRS
nr:hypothetical protein [Kibdelosporangium sp. MJ126-NF4]